MRFLRLGRAVHGVRPWRGEGVNVRKDVLWFFFMESCLGEEESRERAYMVASTLSMVRFP